MYLNRLATYFLAYLLIICTSIQTQQKITPINLDIFLKQLDHTSAQKPFIIIDLTSFSKPSISEIHALLEKKSALLQLDKKLSDEEKAQHMQNLFYKKIQECSISPDLAACIEKLNKYPVIVNIFTFVNNKNDMNKLMEKLNNAHIDLSKHALMPDKESIDNNIFIAYKKGIICLSLNSQSLAMLPLAFLAKKDLGLHQCYLLSSFFYNDQKQQWDVGILPIPSPPTPSIE